MDPVERVAIRSIINEYAVDRIVLVSTHIISDIEQICERLVVLEAGKMSFNGTVSELINMARSRLSKLVFKDITDFEKLPETQSHLHFQARGGFAGGHCSKTKR